MVTKICIGEYVWGIYNQAKRAQSDSLFFFLGGGVLEKGYRRDARQHNVDKPLSAVAN